MNKPYDSLPTQGKHRGQTEGLESGMNVRAPQPPEPEKTPEAQQPVHQILYHEKKGLYRLRLWPGEEEAEPGEGYQEIGRYTPEKGMETALEQLPDEPRYIVFENTRTGEVFFEEESGISDDWTNSGQFDQFTMFTDESAAGAYVEARQKQQAGGS